MSNYKFFARTIETRDRYFHFNWQKIRGNIARLLYAHKKKKKKKKKKNVNYDKCEEGIFKVNRIDT